MALDDRNSGNGRIATGALIMVPASRGSGRLESKASALDRQTKAEALDSM